MLNPKRILLPAAMLLFVCAHAQKRTISGVIRMQKSGETVIGATILVAEIKTAGAISNEYGFYALTLPQGSYHLEITQAGAAKKIVPLSLGKDTLVNIMLDERSSSLQEVTVTAKSNARSLSNPQMGVEQLNIKDISHIPVLLGERDVLKTIQLLPGVKSAGDGNSGFYVRGGNTDQNLILLDEAVVYSASHLLGFFSTFNSDAIKDVTVYKGNNPAQYGGRLSSVLDIKMNDGNNQRTSVSGGIGLISSKLNVEGPIQKDKSSFLISARRTYIDVFLKLAPDTATRNNSLYFYDLNAKANYRLSNKDRIYLSGYFGRDKLGFGNTFGIGWGNATATLRWNHVLNSKLFSNTSFIYSKYNYKININSGANDFAITSQIRDWNVKQEFQLYASEKHNWRFGVNSVYHTIVPGDVSAGENSSINTSEQQRRYAWENAAFLSDNWKTSARINITYGIRLTAFSILGKGDYYHFDAGGNIVDTMHYSSGQFVKTYINPEPRLAMSYRLNEVSSLKVSYARNVQNLHLISNSASSNPTDKWVPSSNIIKPETADQGALGYYLNFSGNLYEFSTEVYYKNMQHQIDYRDGANVNTNQPIETQLLYGKGRAYGAEFFLKKKYGRFNGWIGYTLSKSEKQIDGINDNRWYPARQDRRHDVSVVGIYQLNKKWTLSGTWVYYTGDAVSFPSGKYRVDEQVVFYYTERNGYRMPDYHRLDLSATIKLRDDKKLQSEFSFGVYNAYGRRNAYSIYFRQSENDPSRTEAVKVSLFTFVPSVSYNFKF